ncbi:MAG: ThiF family adenylyltransferase [Clostridium sp.]
MNYSLIIVGCGATGSNIACFASQFAISERKLAEIIVVDGDTVEAKNYRNQKFSKNDIGRNKARVLSNRYRKLGINISFYDDYITRKEDLINIINSATGDLVILVGSVDNNKCRRIMNDVFNSTDTLIYIDTGNGDERNPSGQVVLGCKQNGTVIKDPVCICFPSILDPNMDDDKEEVASGPFSCSQIQEHPQCLATNLLSATTVFLMINNIISYNKLDKTIHRFDSKNIYIR